MSLPQGPSIFESMSKRQIIELQESWKPYIEVVKEDKNGWEDEKALNLALILENTRVAFDRAVRVGLNETTQVSDVGNFKKYYFDLITAVFPNLVAQDIVSIQPLTARTGSIFFLRYDYGSKKGTINRGDTMLDAREGHNTSTGVAYYSSSTIDQEVLGNPGATTYAANFDYIPVVPNTVQITIDGVLVTDDGEGRLVSSTGGFLGAGAGTNVIDYQTGQYNLTLSVAATDQVDVTYEYNNEYAPAQVPEINIRAEELTVTARSRKLKALYSLDGSFDLKMQHGVDIDDALLSAASNEILHEIDADIMNDLYNQAYSTSSWDKTPPHAEISYAQHRELFLDELIGASNKIFSSTQRVDGNFIICGINVASLIESLGAPRFVSNGRTANGPHVSGVLNGKWKVIKNPFYGANQYTIGHKGDTMWDAGYVFAPYLPLFATQLIMGEDFTGRRGFATSNAKKMINPRMYVKGVLNQS